jgi:DNA-directed RNA polymerase subunit N (RpoN/RPB10)
MSTKKGLGRLYDRLTPEERFRLDVLAIARGDEEESERLTATCPRRDYTMTDWDFVGRWEAARDLSMLAYVDVVRRLDKIRVIAAFRGLFPYLSTIWQDDVHWAYFDGHKAGSRHAWNRSGKTGEPPGWEADEEEAERNADPTIDEGLQKWTGEGKYARLEGKLEEMERELEREALTDWLGFARFCEREMGLEAKDLVEALARPFAERVRDLEELSARHEVEADVEGVEEYQAIMREAWCRELESA